MAIPESQLETWSHQGSVSQSRDTYSSVRDALLSDDAAYAGKSVKVFLQGSYGNDTNIYAESDVDTVIRLDSIYRRDMSELPTDQQIAFQRDFLAAEYTFDEFKRGVIGRLTDAFGSTAVIPGNKAIRIKATGSRRSADVVPCYEYRRYTRYISQYDNSYVSGIVFPTQSNGEIINYPKQHADNCTAKHQATSGWFKPMVRIVKNMRSRLIDAGRLSSSIAPSYYIEGLLFNVPNEKFGTNYGDTFCNSVNWLWETDRSKLICANRQYWLLGASNVQWTSANCSELLRELIGLWNSW